MCLLICLIRFSELFIYDIRPPSFIFTGVSCYPGRADGGGRVVPMGGSGGAIVLGKLPVPGRPTIWITVGQGPTALVVGVGGGLFGHFYSHLSFSLLFLPLFGRRPGID